MNTNANLRIVNAVARTGHVRIQRLKPIGWAHIVWVQLADPDGVATYSCEGVEDSAGAVELWTTGHGNLFGKFDEQIAEMRAILAEARA